MRSHKFRKIVSQEPNEGSYYAVNENGDMLQDLIMCHKLGVGKLPEGYLVEFVNGNTLDCRDATYDW